MSIYYRTCQECGHVQQDVDPDAITNNRREAYRERKCKRCGSIALDWGSISDPRVMRVEEDE